MILRSAAWRSRVRSPPPCAGCSPSTGDARGGTDDQALGGDASVGLISFGHHVSRKGESSHSDNTWSYPDIPSSRGLLNSRINSADDPEMALDDILIRAVSHKEVSGAAGRTSPTCAHPSGRLCSSSRGGVPSLSIAWPSDAGPVSNSQYIFF